MYWQSDTYGGCRSGQTWIKFSLQKRTITLAVKLLTYIPAFGYFAAWRCRQSLRCSRRRTGQRKCRRSSRQRPTARKIWWHCGCQCDVAQGPPVRISSRTSSSSEAWRRNDMASDWRSRDREFDPRSHSLLSWNGWTGYLCLIVGGGLGILTNTLVMSRAKYRYSVLVLGLYFPQSCPWVHFMWPDPTQPISWLTQPNTTL